MLQAARRRLCRVMQTGDVGLSSGPETPIAALHKQGTRPDQNHITQNALGKCSIDLTRPKNSVTDATCHKSIPAQDFTHIFPIFTLQFIV